MTPDALIYALHTLAALIWVGGMFFAWMILRPAAVSSLEAPARLTLWAEVLRQRFDKVCARLRLNRERIDLDLSAFRPPAPVQGSLFCDA